MCRKVLESALWLDSSLQTFRTRGGVGAKGFFCRLFMFFGVTLPSPLPAVDRAALFLSLTSPRLALRPDGVSFPPAHTAAVSLPFAL